MQQVRKVKELQREGRKRKRPSPLVYYYADRYPNPSQEDAYGSGTIRLHFGLPLALGDRRRNLPAETL